MHLKLKTAILLSLVPLTVKAQNGAGSTCVLETMTKSGQTPNLIKCIDRRSNEKRDGWVSREQRISGHRVYVIDRSSWKEEQILNRADLNARFEDVQDVLWKTDHYKKYPREKFVTLEYYDVSGNIDFYRDPDGKQKGSDPGTGSFGEPQLDCEYDGRNIDIVQTKSCKAGQFLCLAAVKCEYSVSGREIGSFASQVVCPTSNAQSCPDPVDCVVDQTVDFQAMTGEKDSIQIQERKFNAVKENVETVKKVFEGPRRSK